MNFLGAFLLFYFISTIETWNQLVICYTFRYTKQEEQAKWIENDISYSRLASYPQLFEYEQDILYYVTQIN